MSQFSQEKRKLSLATPLGADVLLLTRFSGLEELSRLFSFRLEMFSPEDALDPTAIVGKAVTWTVSGTGETPRYFNGVVRRFSAGPHLARGVRIYHADVVPWLWFLTRTTNCRIFQHKSVPEIVRAMFDGLGFTHYHFALKGDYPRRNYCVQYRETAFNFVSRLLEQEGIYYFFRHEEGKHTLVLADHTGAYKAGPPSEVEAWEHTYSFCSGKWTHTDYDFEKPSTNLLTHSQTAIPLPHAHKFELFDYPGNYVTRRPAGEGYAKIRMEAEELDYEGASGTGENDTFSPGLKFTLARHDVAWEKGKEYVVTSVQHFAQDPSHLDASKVATYRNEFSCIPARVVYRPVQQTPRPFVQGPQTAVVVGPKGEEIYCDKYGRIKVQFHWDREGKKDENSSCWMRVAQPWAGGNIGMIATPRIGDEVVVDFLEGDPDQPLILGSVYNAGKMPPFSLPENRMFTGIRSKSLHGTAQKNFSGLAFNDTPGGERVAMYAEKDLRVNAEHNHQHHVGNYQHTKIGKLHISQVGGLPGGGGSGGGGTTGLGDALSAPSGGPSFGEFQFGGVSALPAMQGAIVYGVNSQDTFGFMHQNIIGPCWQLFINPTAPFHGWGQNPIATGAAAFGAAIPGLMTSLFGNVQICWGSNWQAVYGTGVSVSHGNTITITGKENGAIRSMKEAVPLATLLYQVAFAFIGVQNDIVSDTAAILYAAYGLLMPVLNGCLMKAELLYKTQQLTEMGDDFTKASAAVEKSLALSDPTFAAKWLDPMMDYLKDHMKMTTEAPLDPTDFGNSINIVKDNMLQAANGILIMARKDKDNTADSYVYIDAVGSGTDGTAFINGTGAIFLSSGGGVISMLSNGTEPSGDITLFCGETGTITLTNLPNEEKALGNWIEITEKSISLFAGPEVSIVLDATQGISITVGVHSIEMGLRGIAINGISMKAASFVQHQEQVMLHDEQSIMATKKHAIAQHQ